MPKRLHGKTQDDEDRQGHYHMAGRTDGADDSRLATQENPCLLWDRKAHYRAEEPAIFEIGERIWIKFGMLISA